jgi:hypothetical protein
MAAIDGRSDLDLKLKGIDDEVFHFNRNISCNLPYNRE